MKIALGIVALLLVIGFGVMSYGIGENAAEGLIYFNKGNDTEDNSRKQLATWGYDTEGFEEAYEGKRVPIEAEDGMTIPMTTYTPTGEEDKDTVILVHGFGGDHVSVYPQAQMYLENGWNVISYDQRGGGDSPSEKVSFGYYEKRDIKAIVDYIRARTQNKKVVVHGFSFGAATTGAYAATDHATANIDAIILDSSFDSMETMFREVLRTMEIPIPEDYIVWCADRVLNIKYGFGFGDTNVIKNMKKCQVPAMIIQGEKDDVATVAMGEAIYESVPGQNKIYWLNNAKHVEAYIDYPVQYKEKVLAFIDDMTAR